MEKKSKLRVDNSGFVRISKKAIKIAKANKKRTGVPIGIYIETAIFEKDESTKNYNAIDLVALKEKMKPVDIL